MLAVAIRGLQGPVMAVIEAVNGVEQSTSSHPVSLEFDLRDESVLAAMASLVAMALAKFKLTEDVMC